LFVHVPTEGGEQGFNMPWLQKPVFGSPEAVDTEERGIALGVLEVVGAPAGKYLVGVRMAASGRFIPSGEINLTKDGEELDAPSNEISNIVKVRLKMARGEPIPKELNLALRNAQSEFVAFKQVEANGEVTFEDVLPGKYAVLVNSPPPPYTIARMATQGVETAGHDITVVAGTSMDLTASIVAGVVAIEGFAKRAGKPMAGVMIALVPHDPENHPERFRRDQSDMDGSFSLGGVLPGSYTLIAVEDAWDSPWMQAGALERYVQHGQNLTIGELMNGKVVLPDAVEVQAR
jgi:hypothetical protein